MMAPLDTASIRANFPGLDRQVAGQAAVFFDGPAGSQVPQSVIDAIGLYLSQHNANSHGDFATSLESDAATENVRKKVACFLGAPDDSSIHFGANMTSLTLAFSRAISKQWSDGDAVVVCSSEHDANFTPWMLAARDAGIEVRQVGLQGPDDALDLEDLRSKLDKNVKLLAIGAAGNALGTVPNLSDIIASAHAVGAKVFVDAVHYAPHRLIDVQAWDCDFLVCSAYKFFGPHVGMFWGRRELMESITPYKVRPAPDEVPDAWMTGTQNFEGIAGVGAAIDYLASLSKDGDDGDLRAQLDSAYRRIREHESQLASRFLEGLAKLSDYSCRGIDDPRRVDERVSTFSFSHRKIPSETICKALAERGIFSWHGNFYAQPVTEALGLEPNGLVRVGFLHYSTAAEVDRLLAALEELA